MKLYVLGQVLKHRRYQYVVIEDELSSKRALNSHMLSFEPFVFS